MERIGFFGGCFNPPTIAHLELAKLAIKEADLDKVIFVPMSDLYDKKELANQNHRYNMIELLIKNEKNIEVSNIEFEQNKRLYAIDAFKLIEEKYDCEKFYIMGADNYSKINSWKSKDELSKFNYIVFDRLNKTIPTETVIVINNKYENISSTIVRNKLKNNEDVNEFITWDVYQYIKLNNLY